MQRPVTGRSMLGRWTSRPVPSESSDRRAQLRWGIGGTAIAVVALLIFGFVYATQPGTREYTARFHEAQTVQNGIDVRVAGIPVGKVSDVRVDFDHVDVTFRVNKDVFVGDASTIDMRMLTTVGGYYLALIPSGRQPLSEPISADRISVPYSLMETFQEATPTVSKLKVQPARESLAQLDIALSSQPDAIRETVGTLNRMVDNSLRQQAQIGDFVKVMNEYSTVANANGEVLLAALRKFGVFFASVNQNLRGHELYLRQIADLMQRIRPALRLYLNEIDPMADRIDGLIARARQAVRDFEPMAEKATEAIERVKAALGPTGALQLGPDGQALLASDLCFPSAVVRC